MTKCAAKWYGSRLLKVTKYYMSCQPTKARGVALPSFLSTQIEELEKDGPVTDGDLKCLKVAASHMYGGEMRTVPAQCISLIYHSSAREETVSKTEDEPGYWRD